MLSVTLKQDLETALENALMQAEPGTPIQQIAERLYDAEPAIMEQLARPFVTQRLVWVMNRVRQHIPGFQTQLVLPGIANIPARLTLATGGRPFSRKATLKQFEEYGEVLLKRKSPRLKTVEKIIEFMRPYNRKKPGITLGEVIGQANFPSKGRAAGA